MKSKIGKLADTEDAIGTRDAVHVPVVLVTSAYTLTGGAAVRFIDSDYKAVRSSDASIKHAIVDPFLKIVKPGEPFLVLLVPDVVTKLTHYYDLAFDDVPKVASRDETEDTDDECRGCY